MQKENEREFHVVLFGATGFVGKLVARYLAEHVPASVRVALAARSLERLRAVRDALEGDVPRSWALIEADAADQASVDSLAARAKVIITVVGPYDKYGKQLARACATHSTHSVDLSGEVLYGHWTANELHAVAEKSRAKVVHSCGFDSVPSDLLALLLAERARADGAGGLEETVMRVVDFAGGVSGGTVDSLRSQVAKCAADGGLARIAADPYALSPDRAREPDAGHAQPERAPLLPWRDAETGQWVAPFVMSGYNSLVVRRSNALLGWSYGSGLRYSELHAFGRSLLAPLFALATSLGLALVALLMQHRWASRVVDWIVPKPGQGPSERTMRSGHFRLETTAATSSGARYRATMAAAGDPGYLRTATMLSECALALALDDDKLPQRWGVLTPATAVGHRLAERLREQGFTIEVERLN